MEVQNEWPQKNTQSISVAVVQYLRSAYQIQKIRILLLIWMALR